MMSTVGHIVELATKARETLGPDAILAVDVGYRFNDVQTCVKICKVLEDLEIYFFETPFPVDTFEPYAKLAAQTTIPLAMGEHAVSRWECLHMIDHGKVAIVQPYMNTVGGITEAKCIVERAKDRGALVIPGNWSTQILGAATVHLAAYSPITPLSSLPRPKSTIHPYTAPSGYRTPGRGRCHPITDQTRYRHRDPQRSYPTV